MPDHLQRRKLAQALGEAARRIREADGDFVAQTAVYALFLECWNTQIGVDNGEWRDLVETASDRKLMEGIRQKMVSTPLPFADYAAEGKDPRIYFYEEFLRAYDSRAAKGRGVHYSPPAVVSYMWRGVETILKEEFCELSERSTVLDPCCGMGTFLQTADRSSAPHKQVIGMEVSEAACALASRTIRDCRILCADSLQNRELDTEGGPLVVIGNPPYSGHSSNAGAIAELIADYKADISERNPKWLQDDYVKFIRMAQHRIDAAGQGILAFITNHCYLTNPTFRAMRRSLMNSFDKVYVLNLHGNALANRESLEADENVFPIRMGVAVAFMVKTSVKLRCKVMYADIHGTREEKLGTLKDLSLSDTPWQEIAPMKPFSIFVPKDARLNDDFYGLTSLFDIFTEYSTGFVTSRDSFAIDTDRNALLSRIADLRDPALSQDEIRRKYRVSDLDIEAARSALLNDEEWQARAVEVQYRPFDKRWAYYSRHVMERPRLPFMQHLMRDNLAIAVGRAGQATGSKDWDVVFCTDAPADLNLFRRGGAMLFPLYRYDGNKWSYNIVKDEEEFFYYTYAILHSRTYRSRYADFLAVDYPRVPVNLDRGTIGALSELGRELVLTHTLRIEPQCVDTSAHLRIGGWDIPGKYLNDRKERDLNPEEQRNIRRIRAAASHTLALQLRIDQLLAQEGL